MKYVIEISPIKAALGMDRWEFQVRLVDKNGDIDEPLLLYRDAMAKGMNEVRKTVIEDTLQDED